MHASVSGSLDRNVYAMLENVAMRIARVKKAYWPVWLAPMQVRLVPVFRDHVEGALRLAERIPFRVDVDDRDEKLGKKIRDAEWEWVPYVVVGERELGGGDVTVRPRLGDQVTMSVEAFGDLLDSTTAGKPRRLLNTPRALSRRPIFGG